MDLSVFKLLRSFLLVLFIALVEYKRGSFTRAGAITGFVLCFVIAYSNIVFLFVMITFVLGGSFATRYKLEFKQSKVHEDEPQRARNGQKYKKTARDSTQVLCNGALACLYAVGYCWQTNCSGVSLPIDSNHASAVYSLGFLFTIVCCCGDTFSSELGPVFARSEPRLVTNPLRTVPIGTNGGVSLAGCLFSLFGGFLVGVSYLAGNLIFCRADHLLGTSVINLPLLLHCTLFGLLGSLIDSVLGATLQYSGYDRERKVMVQTPDSTVEHISGWDVLSNNQVNLASSLLTSLIAVCVVPHALL